MARSNPKYVYCVILNTYIVCVPKYVYCLNTYILNPAYVYCVTHPLAVDDAEVHAVLLNKNTYIVFSTKIRIFLNKYTYIVWRDLNKSTNVVWRDGWTHPLAVDDAEVHAVLDVHVRLEQPPILRNSTSN